MDETRSKALVAGTARRHTRRPPTPVFRGNTKNVGARLRPVGQLKRSRCASDRSPKGGDARSGGSIHASAVRRSRRRSRATCIRCCRD